MDFLVGAVQELARMAGNHPAVATAAFAAGVGLLLGLGAGRRTS